MTKRYIFVPVAYFLFNFSLLAAQNWTEMSDPVRPYVSNFSHRCGSNPKFPPIGYRLEVWILKRMAGVPKFTVEQIAAALRESSPRPTR